MDQLPVQRVTLDSLKLGEASFATVEVRRITIAPNIHPGAHWHNGPVIGIVESGSVHFHVKGEEPVILHAGDTFYEPADTTIVRFDATHEGVTFVGWFPLSAGTDTELTMGEFSRSSPRRASSPTDPQ
ncbi:cupin domain-containing protein [Rathayibacter iranicus]|nr:cupin domain-containing protein [Rathayibacter iranicus]MWV31963.1 cupin domain-containing protein [Rathayibacter iranicus NCPPB 2253 = VKM Ac-1602]PWJ62490.1 Cupin domain-containing protein [Rathayibacter iranicus NCPPB 2253 = VKM Ac-1602]